MIVDNQRWLLRALYAVAALRWRARGMRIDLRRPWPTVHARVRVKGPRMISLGARASVLPYVFLKSAGGVIEIGDRSSVGEYGYLNAVERITIGRGVLIAPGCHITDANHGTDPQHPIRDQPRTVASVRIGDDVWIGAGAKILSGVEIGDGAVVAAGAVVVRDVPAMAIVAGVPARVLRRRDE